MMNGNGLQITAVVAILCLIGGFGAGSLYTSASTSASIEDLEVEISSLKDTVTSMDLRVATLQEQVDENQQIIQSNEVTISNLNAHVIELESELENYNAQVADLRVQISEAENLELVDILELINTLDYRIDRSEAYRILKRTLIKPGAYIIDSITNKLFEELKKGRPYIETFEKQIKDILAKAINAETPSLVWYGESCNQINSYTYQTYVVTYFPLEVDTGIPVIGEIVVARIVLIVVGEVDVNQYRVMSNTIQVVSVEIGE